MQVWSLSPVVINILPMMFVRLCVAAKAAEAEASGHAYYDPVNPHQVYMPGAPPQYAAAQSQQLPGVAPPPYSEAAKKYD